MVFHKYYVLTCTYWIYHIRRTYSIGCLRCDMNTLTTFVVYVGDDDDDEDGEMDIQSDSDEDQPAGTSIMDHGHKQEL